MERLTTAAGVDLLDLHADRDHQRLVLTLVGEDAPRRVARVAVAAIDHRRYRGVHPSLGVVDVVPFVPLDPAAGLEAASGARDRFARWIAAELGVPAFTYGPDGPSLPELRRRAFHDLGPAAGPPAPHPTAGASAVGARPVLVAYNLWLAEPDLDRARAIARSLRSPSVRALGLAVGDQVQVSCNLIDPTAVGPAQVHDQVAAAATVARAELVGLVPAAVLEGIDARRWTVLDLEADRTIEARLARWAAAQAEATPPSD